MIEHLTKVLKTLPGVEVVEYAYKPVSLTHQVETYKNYNSEHIIDMHFNDSEHPVVIILTDSVEGDNYEQSLRGAIDKFQKLMTGKDPLKYYPLPGPVKGCGAWACHIMIDSIPVRVVTSYSAFSQGYITSLDTCRINQ